MHPSEPPPSSVPPGRAGYPSPAPADARAAARGHPSRYKARPARERLLRLHEIGKLLAAFESADATVPPIVEALAAAIPLRSVVFILTRESATTTTVWRARDLSREETAFAAESALASHAYFCGRPRLNAVAPETAAFMSRELGGATRALRTPLAFVVVPLVVRPREGTFGAVQIQPARRLAEADLAFVNLVVNELAKELARADGALGKRRAEERARFMARAQVKLSGPIEPLITPANVVHLAVPSLGDVCVLELAPRMANDGSIEVAAGDDAIAARARSLAEHPEGRRLRLKAMARKRALVVAASEDASHGAVAKGGEVELLRALGVNALIVVPLAIEGEPPLGALAVARTDPSAAEYTAADVAMAQEFAAAAARALVNARLHAAALALVRQREEVLALVSHDLRSPLGVIQLSLASLSRASRGAPVQPGRRASHEVFETLRRAAGRMERMIDDLIDASSIAAGLFSIAPRPCALDTLLVEASEGERLVAEEKGIRLVVDVKSAIVVCDRARIIQLLANLLGNALKFTPSGGVVTLTAAPRDDGKVRVSVADTGPGIALGRQAQVFDQYWRAEDSGAPGVGLGLYIAKRIALAHGEDLWLDSDLGRGSTFSFTLPQAEQAGGHG